MKRPTSISVDSESWLIFLNNVSQLRPHRTASFVLEEFIISFNKKHTPKESDDNPIKKWNPEYLHEQIFRNHIPETKRDINKFLIDNGIVDSSVRAKILINYEEYIKAVC